MSRANPHTTHDNAGIAAWNFKLKGEIGSYEDCIKFACENEAVTATSMHADWALGPKMVLRLNTLGDSGENYYAVVLYNTEIIRYYPDGTFSVDSGGFNTPTTRERLNAVLPYRYSRASGANGSAYFKQKKLGVGGLWPLDHSKRISIETGEIVS